MRRYLLVDDNRAFAENLAEILRDAGDEVVLASSAEEALAVVRQRGGAFDAALTDMRMPGMSGAGLVHALRRIDPGLPVVVATAYSGDDDLALALREGLLAVLPKPVKVARLLALLGAARRDGFVALVEDDAALADNLAEALRERGFTPVLAATVVEAERLGAPRPFVALVDLCVPGGPEGEAMKRLEARFPALPQFVVTGHRDITPPLPPARIFYKPFAIAELLQALEAHAPR